MKNALPKRTETLLELFRESLDVEVPSEDTDLLAEGMLDSLALVELLVQLEQRFNVAVSLENMEIDDFSSIRRIDQFLDRHEWGRNPRPEQSQQREEVPQENN